MPLHPPLPELNALNHFFWTSGADGRLRIQRCSDCGFWLHPPGVICPRCHGRQLAPQVLSGRGRVEAVTVNHQPWMPGQLVPYTLAIVSLAEDPAVRLTVPLVDEPSGSVRIGQAVSVRFEACEDVYLPVFAPVPEEP